MSGPLEVTVTEGTPTLLSIVAVGLPRPEAGITKSKTAFEWVPELVTERFFPAVTVPTSIVAASPLSPLICDQV